MHVQIEPNQVYFDEISYHNISIFLWNLFYGVALVLKYELLFLQFSVVLLIKHAFDVVYGANEYPFTIFTVN